jgi:hypothetical protein
MFNPSGSVTVNGITDRELAEILEIKARTTSNIFSFTPQSLQPASNGQQNWYNGATFTWNTEQGFIIVHEIISFLLKKDEKAKAQGQ